MRLLIKLRATENSSYEMEYHHDIQGLIYNILRGSEYDNHKKQGYKFFAFSNIFPFNDLQKNDSRNLIISSPNSDFISYMKEQIDYLREIRIGQMKFKVDYCDKLNTILPTHDMFTLITGTPIITRIQRYRYEEAGEQQLINGYNSVFWRSDHPVDLFITQLEDNLIKKYNEYHALEDTIIEQRNPIFYKSRFLKQVSTKLFMGRDSEKATVIGTTWEFVFSGASPWIQFALDAGLGELGSMGFGFMNLKREVRQCNN
jgi:CRISPR-associated endoribonuclease Cas6